MPSGLPPPCCALVWSAFIFFTCVCSPGVVTVTGKCECGQLLVIGRFHPTKKKKAALNHYWSCKHRLCPCAHDSHCYSAAACQRKMSFSLHFSFFNQPSHCWSGSRVTLKWRSLIHWSGNLYVKWKLIKLRDKHFVLFQFGSFTFHTAAVAISAILGTGALTKPGSETEDLWDTSRQKLFNI